MGNPKGHRRNFVDDKPDFDGCYITIVGFKGDVLRNMAIQGIFVDERLNFDGCYITIMGFKGDVLRDMAIQGIFVDDKPDFDGCYITIVGFKGNVLRNVAIRSVFVDGRRDFDGCYITIRGFEGNVLWILQNAVKRRNYLANHFRPLFAAFDRTPKVMIHSLKKLYVSVCQNSRSTLRQSYI